MNLERGGYFKSLGRLGHETVDQLLEILRQQRLTIDPVAAKYLSGSSGPKITEELTRLPLYQALGLRSWSGLVVCFPGTRDDLSTASLGTPYIRRLLYPMLDLHRRLQKTVFDTQCIYLLGERFPEVILKKFRLLDQVIPHLIILTGDLLKSRKLALPRFPLSRDERWAQAVLCRAMYTSEGLNVPSQNDRARLGFIAAELPTGEGTKHPERLDILAYDKDDHSLVAVEIKGPSPKRVELENLLLQGLAHCNWLESNKMALKLMFDGVRGSRINTRKRVRLLVASFEDQFPPLFLSLKEQALRKDRHLAIDLGKMVIRGDDSLDVVSVT